MPYGGIATKLSDASFLPRKGSHEGASFAMEVP
jgi:hypothetical protein